MEIRYRYYMLMRPCGPGAQPKGIKDWGELDGKTVIPSIGHHAWAWIEYDRKLTDKEISDYELAPDERRNVMTLEHAIIERAEKMGLLRDDKITHMLDIDNANKEFNLRFEDWLGAEDFDFAHDWFGIRQHMDRKTCRMSHLFVPRFAGYEG